MSLVILGFVFFVGWTLFLNLMVKQYNSIKIMLGIINVEYMIENSYILHFINNELIKRAAK
jgi:hypothetical protein